MEKKERLIVTQANINYPFSIVDKEIKKLSTARKTTRPEKGWIHEIRKQLKIPVNYIATRFKKPLKEHGFYLASDELTEVSTTTVHLLEKSEMNGTISINSLRRIAEAMDMELVYGFIPKQNNSIEDMLRSRLNDGTEGKSLSEVEIRKALKNPKSFWNGRKK